MKNIVSRILSVHKEHEVLLKLEAAGLNDELAQKVIDSKDNDLATKVVKLIQNGGFMPSTSQKEARAIMGKNFFGVEEAIRHFGTNPTKQQLDYLVEVPFTEEVLKSCKNTHVLVAVFPMSFLDVYNKFENKLFYRHRTTWYIKHAFMKDEGRIGWQLVRKTPVDNSTNKTWDQQQALLPEDEETPKAQVMVYTIIGHFLATGERLFEKINVRCLDLDSNGNRVYVVGNLYAKGQYVGLYFDSWYNHSSDGNLGVSGVKKQ